MLQIKPAVSFSNDYLDKVYGLLNAELDAIDTKGFETRYDQMKPFFELYSRLRKLTEDLDSFEMVDLMEDLIVKKNLAGFGALNFVRTLNDLRLCALDDIVESKVIKARDLLVKLRYLLPFYRLLIDLESDLQLDYLEQSAYLQREFFELFPKLRDSFHFLLTCDLETLDKLNLDGPCSYEHIHRKLSQQRDATLSHSAVKSALQNDGRFVHAESCSSSCESEEDMGGRPSARIKLNELDKVLLNNRELYVGGNATGNGRSPSRPNGQREELIAGEIKYAPDEKVNHFISAQIEGKHKVLMLLSMQSTINVINAFTFHKLTTIGGQQARQCFVDLAINSAELGLQHAFVLSLDAHFGFVKVKMNFFYFDELDVPIKQNLIGNSFIEHIQTLSPYNYFTLKEEPEVKHHFLAESA